MIGQDVRQHLAPTKNLEQQPATPALILVDSSFVAVSYNSEALKILAYPHDPKTSPLVGKHVEATLETLLAQLRLSPRSPSAVFRSGRRQYAIRIFSLKNHRKTSSSIRDLPVANAILIERQERKEVDLLTVCEQFHLTPRERETLHFLLQGMTSKEIATHMSISPHTVKAFLRMVMSKMQVGNRPGIIGKIVSVTRR